LYIGKKKKQGSSPGPLLKEHRGFLVPGKEPSRKGRHVEERDFKNWKFVFRKACEKKEGSRTVHRGTREEEKGAKENGTKGEGEGGSRLQNFFGGGSETKEVRRRDGQSRQKGF